MKTARQILIENDLLQESLSSLDDRIISTSSDKFQSAMEQYAEQFKVKNVYGVYMGSKYTGGSIGDFLYKEVKEAEREMLDMVEANNQKADPDDPYSFYVEKNSLKYTTITDIISVETFELL